MLNFDFLEKGLGIVSLPHFVYDFSRKMFLVLYSINWPNFIVKLSLLLDILINMCIAVVCFPGCDIINFEINIIFLIKPLFYMTKRPRQKFKYLKNKKSFQVEIKSIFHHFQTWEWAFRLLYSSFSIWSIFDVLSAKTKSFFDFLYSFDVVF